MTDTQDPRYRLAQEDIETVRYLSQFVGFAACGGTKCRLPHCGDCFVEPLDEGPALHDFHAALSRLRAENAFLNGRVLHLESQQTGLYQRYRDQDAEVERLKEDLNAETNRRAHHQHQEFLLRKALDRAGDRLAQVQPGVTEPWAFGIVPQAEREIAAALSALSKEDQ